ncbi:unnamed protein product [Closterium sp. NIES-64]|nr:unnamed protein product [Closterium sp. NIES-64]
MRCVFPTVSLGSCGITQSSSSPSPLPLLWNGAHLFGLGSGVALVYSSAASSYTAPRLLSCSSATPPFSTTAFQQAMPLGSCPTGADSVLVGMWHDLPETPRQEEQLRRAKVAAEAASDAKSIVLRNMRHEICTPMHANNPVLLVPLTRSLPFPSPFHLLPVCPFASPSPPLPLPLPSHFSVCYSPFPLPFPSPSPPSLLPFLSASPPLRFSLLPLLPHFPSPSPPFPLPIPFPYLPVSLLFPSPYPPPPLLVPSPFPPHPLSSHAPGFQVRPTCALPEVSAGWGEVGGEMGVGGVGGGGEGRGGGGIDLQEANRAALYQPSVPALSYVRWQFVSGPPASICMLCAIPYVKLFCYFLIRTDLAIIDSQSLPLEGVNTLFPLPSGGREILSSPFPLEGVNTLFPLPSGGREYSLPPSLWRA